MFRLHACTLQPSCIEEINVYSFHFRSLQVTELVPVGRPIFNLGPRETGPRTKRTVVGCAEDSGPDPSNSSSLTSIPEWSVGAWRRCRSSRDGARRTRASSTCRRGSRAVSLDSSPGRRESSRRSSAGMAQSTRSPTTSRAPSIPGRRYLGIQLLCLSLLPSPPRRPPVRVPNPPSTHYGIRKPISTSGLRGISFRFGKRDLSFVHPRTSGR